MNADNQVDIPENVIKSEFVKWRKLAWLQNGDLKDMTNDDRDRLIVSLKRNGKIKAFHVWEDENKKLWILDGHHLKSVLKYMEDKLKLKLPDLYRADFIKCKDKKHAKKLVLDYSAVYTSIDPQGLYNFAIEAGWDETDFSQFEEEINFDSLGLEDFINGYFGEPGNGKGKGLQNIKTEFEIVIECQNESEQERTYNKLKGEGYTCRILTL